MGPSVTTLKSLVEMAAGIIYIKYVKKKIFAHNELIGPSSEI